MSERHWPKSLAALRSGPGCGKGRALFGWSPGLLSLAVFAWLLTLALSDFAGRAYAAYGGVYIAASLVWLWAVEKQRPDTWDMTGVAICLAGAAVILFAPRGVGGFRCPDWPRVERHPSSDRLVLRPSEAPDGETEARLSARGPHHTLSRRILRHERMAGLGRAETERDEGRLRADFGVRAIIIFARRRKSMSTSCQRAYVILRRSVTTNACQCRPV